MITSPLRRCALAFTVTSISLVLVTVTSPALTRATRASATTPTTVPMPGAAADDRLVVGLEPGASAREASAIARAAGVTGADVVDDHTIVVDAPPGGVGAAPAARLLDDARVRYVEPNYVISSTFTPNDPTLPSLGALLDAQPGGIRAQSAWNTTLGSPDVVVGVLDSGIDPTHPDLTANLWSNRLGIGGCGYETHGYDAFTGQCTSADPYGHGTHVAGIIGAVGNNGIGITGVAPRVSLMSLRMLDQFGNGTIAGAIGAIDWAVKARRAGVGLRILSASWGGVFSQGLTDAIHRAGDAGILIVAAAGNSGVDVEQEPVFPCAADLPNVVCVAASMGDDSLAPFSDFGAVHVALAAPGQGIISTVPPGAVPGCGQNLYCALDGTSMAAPMVSGAGVLALAADPALSVDALRARLVAAVDPVPALAGKVASGGRLDACKLVPGCGATLSRPPSPPTAVGISVAHGQATLQWSEPASNGNGSGITGYAVDAPGGTQVLAPGRHTLTLTGLRDNRNVSFAVRARNAAGESASVRRIGRPFNGGFVVHSSGRLARLRTSTGPKLSPTDPVDLRAAPVRARGVAVLPDGTGGYVLDGFGVLHPFGIGGNRMPVAPTGGPYSAASDWARGVALMPDGTGGYVVDRSGQLYGFSIGDHARPPAPTGGPVWSGDVARGVAIVASGTGGYVVERSGTIFGFGIGAGAPPAPATGTTTWPGQDMVRGIGLGRASGGGFVLDQFAGVHPFATRGQTPVAPVSGPSWPGVDRARGIGL